MTWEEIERIEDVWERCRIARDKVKEAAAVEGGMYQFLRKKDPVRTRVLTALHSHIVFGQTIIQAFEELRKATEQS